MRKKIARRWRREALRRGVIITSEKMVFSRKEMREHGYVRRDNSYAIEATFNGLKYSVADDDMLSAYKLLIWCIETTGQDAEQGVLAGFVITDHKGFAKWFVDR